MKRGASVRQCPRLRTIMVEPGLSSLQATHAVQGAFLRCTFYCCFFSHRRAVRLLLLGPFVRLCLLLATRLPACSPVRLAALHGEHIVPGSQLQFFLLNCTAFVLPRRLGGVSTAIKIVISAVVGKALT